MVITEPNKRAINRLKFTLQQTINRNGLHYVKDIYGPTMLKNQLLYNMIENGVIHSQTKIENN